MILVEDQKEVEVKPNPLLEDLLIKWGYCPSSDRIDIKDMDKITLELSSWGIPWKRTKWNFTV